MKKTETIKELRDFLFLWSSQAVSSLGTAMTEYALIIWTYGQKGTASSLSILTLCSFLPTILFRFAAGTFADRWDKKRFMLFADLFAALGTLTVFVLYSLSALRIWHLCLINILLSFMNAFQAPAAFAATSLLVPKKHYSKAGGLQSFSGAAISILAPVLGGILLTFGGLKLVLICDILSFFTAVLVLSLLVSLPKAAAAERKDESSLLKSCLDGIRHLHKNKAVFRVTLFMTLVNFLAKLGNDGMLAPFILAQTGNDQQILGFVQSFVAAGLLTGSVTAAAMKPVKNHEKAVYLGCAIIFAGNIIQGVSDLVWVWCIAAFGTYLTAAVMNTNLMTFIREQVPLEMHGRVFSAKDTLQNCAIPMSLFLGGVLADRIFEPFMLSDHPLKKLLSPLFGAEKGSGIAVMFFCVGTVGVLCSLIRLKKSNVPGR